MFGRDTLRAFGAFFWYAFLRGFTRRLLLVVILLLVGAILFLDLGGSAGLPALFWHELVGKQLLAGFAVGMLVFVIFFVAFLLDTQSDERNRWLARLSDATQTDLLLQLRYYVTASVIAVALIGVGAALLWYGGLQVEHLYDRLSPRRSEIEAVRQAEKARSNAPQVAGNQATLETPMARPLHRLPFVGGFAAAAFVLALLGRVASPFFAAPKFRKPIRRGRRAAAAPAPAPAPAAPMADVKVVKRRLQWLIRTVAVVLIVIYLCGTFGLTVATPASALCTLLALVTIAYGYMVYNQRNRTLLLLVLALLMMLGGLPRYKIQIPGLSFYYPHARLADPYPEPTTRASPATQPGDLIRTVDVNWTAPGQRRPLVLVCVSGGGIRASVWSAAVLCALERRMPDFPYHIRMIAGASGGMVGAGYYTATLMPPAGGSVIVGARARHAVKATPPSNDPLRTLVNNLACDSLSVPVKRMIFHDLPLVFLPVSNGDDRGRALEEQWKEYWDSNLDTTLTGGRLAGSTTFRTLWAGERAGWRPSLVFTPMLVEDGRRLIISNLALDCLAQNHGPRLQGYDARSLIEPDGLYSRSAVQLADVFPAAWPDFQVVTAARLSASFPYVSPASVLPTAPRRRVVDAGYYDNYGVTAAAAWLSDCLTDPAKLDWLKAHVSGVLVLQVRDGRNKLSADNVLSQGSNGSPGGRGIEWLTSPVTGIMSARDSVSVFRNDGSLQKVAELFNELDPKHHFGAEYFAVATVEFDGEAPLSWYLTQAEIQALVDDTEAPEPGQDHPAYQELNEIEDWFNSRPRK